MSVTVYVPRDASAVSVGADEVASAIAREAARRGESIRLRRNGSRGLAWLEPLVEVETPQGRLAYGPVATADVPALFDAGFLSGAAHTLALGPVDAIPALRRQQRVTAARLGQDEGDNLAAYVATGGYAGLRRALAMSPVDVVAEVTGSGLRGRGGAAFPTGIKWKTCAEAAGTQKYIVANADEGDSGTFADRLLMEGDPYSLIEGMTIAAYAVGASRGYIYLRIEYPHAQQMLLSALAHARAAGWLGPSIGGTDFGFELEVRMAAGAYVCGEETALLESLEGKRGQVRFKPPLPAHVGLFGKPTVVNNVVTLATVPWILANGATAYRELGTGNSRGTALLQLAGNIRHGGLYEVPFGMSLRELLYDIGGGTLSGRPIRAVQIGGPLGAYLAEKHFDTALDYESLAANGGLLGHGGIVVFDDSVDMAEQARFAMEFCAAESCGKCTPCRIGSVRGMEVIDRLRAGDVAQETLLRDLCDTLLNGSLCALGGMTPYPVLSALDHFPDDFRRTETSR
ncbi:formate dehydrogenase beta subunit [Tahibacter amnicola]|uniref:NADH-quinone oxidoreductase subunit F n=1 Tax=Tahibacter amnicola TaxID=2976241 RepID=A0ABY6BCV3_9GAMM|nr:NADH-quinone oxidoreductase subunit NuoF [Tahibacter amnicola]UXI67866.1 NADH-quinone oxidoreductase subunit NuoF [Tahibacter amnicola]